MLPLVNLLVEVDCEEAKCGRGDSERVQDPVKLDTLKPRRRGEERRLGGEDDNGLEISNIIIIKRGTTTHNNGQTCKSKRTNATVMHVGCHEKRSEPGEER